MTAKELVGLRGFAWAVDVAGDSGSTTTPSSLVVDIGILGVQHSLKPTSLQDGHWFGLRLLFAPSCMGK